MNRKKTFLKRTFIATAVIAGIYFCIFNTSIVLFFIGMHYDSPLMMGLSSLSAILSSLIISIIMTVSADKKQKRFMNAVKNQFDHMSEGDFSYHIDIPVHPRTMEEEIIENINCLNDELAKVSVLKKDFIKNFSHEFKTPIASIKGFSELLIQGNLSKEEENEYHQIILEESTRLSHLAQSTLLLSKLESSSLKIEKENYDFQGQIEQCVLLLYDDFKAKNQQVEVNLPHLTIQANKDLLKEVVINLLTNANKYTPENGKIEIFYHEEENQQIVSVKDNGIGISKVNLSHIFEDYFQAEQSRIGKGIGLGLAIVKKILEVHSFQIQVESEEGKGSCFSIIIPKQLANEITV